MNLYELNYKLASYEMDIDPETGEWLNEDELNEIQMERDTKIENLALYVKNLRAEKDAVDSEKAKMDKRSKTLAKKISRLEDYIASNLNGEKFSTPRVKVSFRPSESVDIPDDYAVPDEFVNLSVVRKPVKANIKAYIKQMEAKGEKVPWASISRHINMKID